MAVQILLYNGASIIYKRLKLMWLKRYYCS